MPEGKKDVTMTLEIKDASGNLVRTFSSKKDSLFKKWDSSPAAEPILTTHKGLNRFVWNMRYPTMIGIENIYFEASFAGHKAVPGKYTINLKIGEQQVSTTAEILANPLYPNDLNAYKEYNTVMSFMEKELILMHQTVMTMDAKRQQLEQLLKDLPSDNKFKAVNTEGAALVKKMKTWDEDMVQRKSKAYDDVENFPNKFTAEYLFLINQTESDIPVVNQPSLDRKRELDAQWAVLKAKATEILDNEIPALNKKLWDLGVGGIWKK